MARRGALPRAHRPHPPAAPHPRRQHLAVAAIAIVWYVGIYQVSANALFDSLTALALLIAFYYALTGIACAVYYRKHLRERKNLLLIGVGPLVGAGLLVWLLVLSIRDMSDPENSYSGQAWLGVGPPLVIGVGIFVARRGVHGHLADRTSGTGRSRPGCPTPTSSTASRPRDADPDGLEG